MTVSPSQSSRAIPPGSRNSARPIAGPRKWFVYGGLFITIVGLYPAWQQLTFSREFSRAKNAMSAGDFSNAIEALEHSAQLKPKRADIAYMLAVAYRRSGKIDKVEPELKRASQGGWPEEDVKRQRLLIKAQVGRFHEVEPELKQIFEQGTYDEAAVEIYEALSQGYWTNHEIQEALRCLDYWIQWRPQDINPRMMRADAYNEFNDPVSAEKDYRGILQFAPDHFNARELLGRLLVQRGEVEAAEAEFDYCLQRGYRGALAVLGKAECAFRSGRPEDADHWAAQLDHRQEPPERQAKILKLKADIARFRQDNAGAIALLVEAVQVWPHDAAVHQSLGAAYAAVGNRELGTKHLEIGRTITDRAQRYYDLERRVISEPKNAELRFEVGDVLQQQGLISDAAGWWHSAIRCDPFHQLCYEELTRYYGERGEKELEARYRDSAGKCLDASFRHAWNTLQDGELEKSKRWRAALAPYPQCQPLCEVLDIALLNKDGKFADALQRLAAAAPQPALASFLAVIKAESLVGLGKPMEAEKLLRETLRSYPEAVDVHRWLAVIYYDVGAGDNASFHLKRVSSLDPRDYRPDRLLGLMNKDYEVFDQAAAHYRESLRRNPIQAPREEVLIELSQCLVRLRDYTGAMQTLNDAKPSVERSVLMAECHYNMGETERAVKLLDEVLRDSPKHLNALLLRADAAATANDNPMANELLTRAVEEHPFDYTARHRISQVLTRLGNTAEASQHSKRAEELKQAREQFAKLHEQAFQKPYDAPLRRELARMAGELGQSELVDIWKKAAESLEMATPPAADPTLAPAKKEPPAVEENPRP